MSKVWEYRRGSWEEIPNPMDKIQDNDGDTIIKKLGYKTLTPGFPDDPNIKVWERTQESEEPWEYFVQFSLNGDTGELVFFPDFPSFLMFMRDFGPIIDSQRMHMVLDVLPKVFHIWHGHGWFMDCVECDPLRSDIVPRRKRT